VAQSVIVIYIFTVQGMNLKVEDIKQALNAYVPVGVACVSILFLTPFAAFLVAPLPFLADDMKIGLTLFLCVPTTVNSGVALVGAAEGSVPTALFITVLSNSLGVFTVPIMLQIMLSTAVRVDINPIPMLIKLILTILVPALFGMFCRRFETVQKVTKTYKEPIGLSTHVALASIPFMKVGSSRDEILALDGGQLVGVVGTAIVLHVLLLVVLYAATAPFPKNIPEAMRKAVVILGSEKTLPVSMAVLASFPEDLGAKGMLAVPCILGHLSQLLIDGVVASRWAAKTQAEKDALAAAGEQETAKAEDMIVGSLNSAENGSASQV
jgi:sodium/bile acid cotransporter 7